MSYDKINQDHVDGCPQYLRVLDDHDRHQKIHGETKKSDKSQCDRCSDVHHRTDLIIGIVNDIVHGATVQGHSSCIFLPLHFHTFPPFFFFFLPPTRKRGKSKRKSTTCRLNALIVGQITFLFSKSRKKRTTCINQKQFMTKFQTVRTLI